jgi:hypothetical protein
MNQLCSLRGITHLIGARGNATETLFVFAHLSSNFTNLQHVATGADINLRLINKSQMALNNLAD